MKNRMLVFASGLACLNVALPPVTMGANGLTVAFARVSEVHCRGAARRGGLGDSPVRGVGVLVAEEAGGGQLTMPRRLSGLVVNIADAKHDDGSAGVALWNGPEGFPEEIEHAIRVTYVPVVAGVASASFEDLAPGRYAVTVYNDRNRNETFDKNWVGMPRESWGVSNNARPRLRAPGYGEAAFDLDAGVHRLEIELR